MSRKIRVIFGGRSAEHEVSVTSAESVMAALDGTKYDVHSTAITRSGRWINDISPSEYREKRLDRDTTDDAGDLFPAEFLNSARTLSGPEVIVPILHGPFGEDGTIQGLLEMADLPYVGSGVLGSALAMDKANTKHLCLAHGIPVVDFEDFPKALWISNRDDIINTVEVKLGYPCFVKPANLGSSIGISRAHTQNELGKAIDNAFHYDMKVIVERGLNCREIECSVLGNYLPEASIAGEIIPCNEFYDYNAKYVDGKSELIIPAKISAEQMQEVQDIAIGAFIALECSGMSRADFFLDVDSDEILFNEINTIPGFTSISMYPKLWEASGLSYPELLDKLIDLALERYKDKQEIHGNLARPADSEKT